MTDQTVSVNTRFTQIKSNTVYSAATQTGVCQGDTSRYGPVNIGANTTFTLYVTKPFLGSMTIPKTDIAVIKGAWVDGMGSPSTGDFHDLVKLSIQEKIPPPDSRAKLIRAMLLRLILDSSMVRNLPPAMPCQTVLLQ